MLDRRSEALSDTEYLYAAEVEEIPNSDALIVDVEGRQVALFQLEDGIFALENFCPHRGGPIGEGLVGDGRVTCPWHEWTFEIRTGVCTFNPSAVVRRFPVTVRNGRVFVARTPEQPGEQ